MKARKTARPIATLALSSGDAALTRPTTRLLRATTLVTDLTPKRDMEPVHIALASMDGTPGTAVQVHGTFRGSILASVDRRRCPVNLAVDYLRDMFGPATEIAIGVMPSAVTR